MRSVGNTPSASRVTRDIQLLCLQFQKLLFYSGSAHGPLLKCRPTLPGRYSFFLEERHSTASLMKQEQGETRKCSLSPVMGKNWGWRGEWVWTSSRRHVFSLFLLSAQACSPTRGSSELIFSAFTFWRNTLESAYQLVSLPQIPVTAKPGWSNRLPSLSVINTTASTYVHLQGRRCDTWPLWRCQEHEGVCKVWTSSKQGFPFPFLKLGMPAFKFQPLKYPRGVSLVIPLSERRKAVPGVCGCVVCKWEQKVLSCCYTASRDNRSLSKTE